jgi:hypothetical protein
MSKLGDNDVGNIFTTISTLNHNASEFIPKYYYNNNYNNNANVVSKNNDDVDNRQFNDDDIKNMEEIYKYMFDNVEAELGIEINQDYKNMDELDKIMYGDDEANDGPDGGANDEPDEKLNTIPIQKECQKECRYGLKCHGRINKKCKFIHKDISQTQTQTNEPIAFSTIASNHKNEICRYGMKCNNINNGKCKRIHSI